MSILPTVSAVSARQQTSAPSGQANSAWYQPLVLVLLAASSGIALDHYFPLSPMLSFGAAVALAALWLLCWSRGTAYSQAASMLLLGGWLFVGAAWHHDRWSLYPGDEIGLSLREEIRPICLEGTAMVSPRWIPAPPLTSLRTIPKGDQSDVAIWVTGVRDGQTWHPASGWAGLSVDGHLLGVQAGDRLRLMVLASRPLGPLNPGEFNFARYQRTQRIGCRLRGIFPESVQVVERGSSFSPRLLLSQMREQGSGLLRKHVSDRRSTLAAAILLGAREQLDPERNEGFLVTGTIHVLSISGLHVGILAYGFWTLFRTGLFPRKLSLIAAMALTILYALLTDLQPPVVRATILIIAMCVARMLGRKALGYNVLAASGLVVLALNPCSLFLAGTQLSFMAVAVMIAFGPLLNPLPIHDPLDRLIAATRPWYVRLGKAWGGEVWRVWLTGAVIWVISLPLVWQQYNLVSPVALLMNPLVWLPITVSLFAGFGVLVFGTIFPPAAHLCGWLTEISLQAIEGAISWGQHSPGSYFWIPPPPSWWIAVFYIAIGLLAIFPLIRPSRRWSVALGCLWLGVAIWLASFPMDRVQTKLTGAPPKLACTFVSVGHGTSALIELPDGRNILYDAGKLGSPLGAVRPISAVLWQRGITHLDAVVISHADADHFNALPELLNRFSVGVIYVSPVMFLDQQTALVELAEGIQRKKVPLKLLRAGDRLATSPGIKLEVLHPPAKGVIGSDNANSIVLVVEYAGQRILLPGDLESPGLEDLLAEEPVQCAVVMAPHHGSKRSDPSGLAFWSKPQFVLISGKRDVEDIGDIQRVQDSYRARGATVFHTALQGAVRFEILASGKVTAQPFRQLPVSASEE